MSGNRAAAESAIFKNYRLKNPHLKQYVGRNKPNFSLVPGWFGTIVHGGHNYAVHSGEQSPMQISA